MMKPLPCVLVLCFLVHASIAAESKHLLSPRQSHGGTLRRDMENHEHKQSSHPQEHSEDTIFHHVKERRLTTSSARRRYVTVFARFFTCSIKAGECRGR